MPLGWMQKWRHLRALRRQETGYRRSWQEFTRYPTLADGRHDDANWRAHNGRFAACLIRVPAERLQPRLDELRSALEPGERVRLHPDHFLHIMIQEIGFVCKNPSLPDELSYDRFDEVSIALSSALADLNMFTIDARGVNSFEDAAFLEVHDGGGCVALHKRLREVAAVPMIPRYAFLPHITMAHYLSDFDSTDTINVLREFRDVQFGTFDVTEVEIATLRVDIDYPPIYTTRTLTLRK